MPFHTKYSKLTPAQHEAIGRVAASWSVVEFAIETVLARLVRAPDFPTLALTNNLSIENRLTAMRDLIAVHQFRYGAQIIDEGILDELSRLPTEIGQKKNTRNRIIHLVWFRGNDREMFGTKFKGKPPTGARLEPYQMLSTVDEINAFADELTILGDRIFALAQQIPEIDESSLQRFGRP